jgi:hypothetical protein
MRSDVLLPVALAVAVAVAGCGTDDTIFGNVVDPQDLAGLTKFRSCCGHSFASGESNRTMKHYLVPKATFIGRNDLLPVRSPCDGKIVSISAEQNRLACLGDAIRGDQVRIVCRARPDVSIRIFHVNPSRGPGSVDKGELLGHADLRVCPEGSQPYADLDVAVEKLASLYSYVEWLDDAAFEEWQARGLATRAEAVISKADRDASPCDYSDYLMCQADTITFPP